jgi:hypothetical protein
VQQIRGELHVGTKSPTQLNDHGAVIFSEPEQGLRLCLHTVDLRGPKRYERLTNSAPDLTTGSTSPHSAGNSASSISPSVATTANLFSFHRGTASRSSARPKSITATSITRVDDDTAVAEDNYDEPLHKPQLSVQDMNANLTGMGTHLEELSITEPSPVDSPSKDVIVPSTTHLPSIAEHPPSEEPPKKHNFHRRERRHKRNPIEPSSSNQFTRP